MIRSPTLPLYGIAVELSLRQVVRLDRDSTTKLYAATWEAATWYGILPGGGLEAGVRKIVQDMTDSFINAYLAANPKGR